MLPFDKKYFLWAAVLFVVEVLIALFVRDAIIRPYVGDFLVVILLYCSIRTFLNGSVLKVSIGVLLFAYLLEVLQYFRLVGRLGLSDNLFAKTVIGYGFAWLDMVAYTLGILMVVAVERKGKFKGMS
ncbi:MAG TPA: DUF2809 domain-containing protein [Chitinophagaceae bacterium]